MNKGVLKNFSKFTGKHLCWSLSFNKVADPGTGVFQRILHFFKSIFFSEHLWTTASVLFTNFSVVAAMLPILAKLNVI